MENPYDAASIIGGIVTLGALGYTIASGKGKDPIQWMFGVALMAIIILPVLIITKRGDHNPHPYWWRVVAVIALGLLFQIAVMLAEAATFSA